MSEKIFSISKAVKMPKVTIKPPKEAAKKFKAAFVKSFQSSAFKTERQIGYWLDDAMENPTWNWQGGTTIRKDGSSASSPRNIVDTGKLKSSKKLTTKFGSTQVRYEVKYTADYAGIIHWGGYITPYGRGGTTTYLPGRPWIQLVFREDANEGDSEQYNFLADIKEQMVEDLGKF